MSESDNQTHAELRQIGNRLVALETVVAGLQREFVDLKKNLVTQAEFTPVKNVVYGLMAGVMMAVLTAVTALVLK